jgi:hypothetical protein
MNETTTRPTDIINRKIATPIPRGSRLFSSSSVSRRSKFFSICWRRRGLTSLSFGNRCNSSKSCLSSSRPRGRPLRTWRREPATPMRATATGGTQFQVIIEYWQESPLPAGGTPRAYVGFPAGTGQERPVLVPARLLRSCGTVWHGGSAPSGSHAGSQPPAPMRVRCVPQTCQNEPSNGVVHGYSRRAAVGHDLESGS